MYEELSAKDRELHAILREHPNITEIDLLSRYNERVIQCIREGANVNCHFSMEETALRKAVVFGNLELMNLLLDNGADIDTMDIYAKQTALHVAARVSRAKGLEPFKLLLHRGADFTIRESALHKTPLDLLEKSALRELTSEFPQIVPPEAARVGNAR